MGDLFHLSPLKVEIPYLLETVLYKLKKTIQYEHLKNVNSNSQFYYKLYPCKAKLSVLLVKENKCLYRGILESHSLKLAEAA